jgi:hypothetical protein
MIRAISTRSIRLKRTLFKGPVSRKKSLVKKDIIVYIPPLIMLRLSVYLVTAKAKTPELCLLAQHTLSRDSTAKEIQGTWAVEALSAPE